VRVATVRYAVAEAGHAGQLVAIHDDDVGVLIGEDTGGQQASHATAEHHCAFSMLVLHHGCLLAWRAARRSGAGVLDDRFTPGPGTRCRAANPAAPGGHGLSCRLSLSCIPDGDI